MVAGRRARASGQRAGRGRGAAGTAPAAGGSGAGGRGGAAAGAGTDARCSVPGPGAARPLETGAGGPGTAAGRRPGPARPGPVELRSGRCRSLPCPLGSRGAEARRGPAIRAAAPVPPPEAGSGRDRVINLSAARFEAARFQLRSKSLGLACDFQWSMAHCKAWWEQTMLVLRAEAEASPVMEKMNKPVPHQLSFLRLGVSKHVRQVHSLLTDNTSQRLTLQPLEPASPALGAWPWCGVSAAEESLALGVAGIT
ncbi:uncharacterized protein LOC128812206 [Vidua macroura]|uniref:uncharacterized protein LOC128812206 n=1 Tax=Vidua macroura TaxID=187451 RepID=UPI0023A8346C|nr:uncharacterized protein LOC128812206 [Vidua macroura]